MFDIYVLRVVLVDLNLVAYSVWLARNVWVLHESIRFWDRIFKNEPSNFFKNSVFHNSYLVHYWILLIPLKTSENV